MFLRKSSYDIISNNSEQSTRGGIKASADYPCCKKRPIHSCAIASVLSHFILNGDCQIGDFEGKQTLFEILLLKENAKRNKIIKRLFDNHD